MSSLVTDSSALLDKAVGLLSGLKDVSAKTWLKCRYASARPHRLSKLDCIITMQRAGCAGLGHLRADALSVQTRFHPAWHDSHGLCLTNNDITPGPTFVVPVLGGIIEMVKDPYTFWENQRLRDPNGTCVLVACLFS